jgi:beta-lactamase regulating signal transducer with metallopeptidase domain
MFDSVIPPWVASTATAWLLTYALHSTLLLGIAWLVSRRMAGRSPLAEEAVWRAAMVGALMTASLQVAGGWEPLGGSWQLDPEEAAVVSTPSWEHVEATLAAPAPRDRQPVEAAPIAAAPAPAPWVSPVGIPAAVLGLWLGGVLLVGLACARGYVLLHRRLRHRPEVIGGTLFEMLRRLSGEAGLAQEVHLGCSSRVPVPVALGGRRPEICVPPRALAALTAEQQEGMLAHELAHLVRRDPFWLAFTNLLTALFFFQPLQWVARRRLREISETLCDAWAVERTGRPLSLAQCLAEVAGWSFQPLGALPVAASMADRPSHLSRRIRRLLEGSSPEGAARRRWLALAMGALVLVVAIAAPGVSAAVRTAQEAPGIEEPAEADEDYDVDSGLSEAEEAELEALGEEIESAVEPALDELDDELDALEELGDLDGELDALEELGELDELDALEDFGEQMAELGEGMTLLAQAHATTFELSEEEMEEISRNAEKIAERVEALMGPEMERIHEELGRKVEVLHDQMPTAEMKRLEAEMEALAEKMQPSDEEMHRLHSEIEKLRQEGKLKGGELSREERERLRAEARRIAERHRMSDEDREKMRDLARKHREEANRFMAEHRDEIEAARREAREQSRIVREQFQRRLEEDPELRALRERHRQDMERHRGKMREDRRERSEERRKRSVAPVPPTPRAPGVAPAPPAPRPSAVPAPAPSPAPRAVRSPRPVQAVAPVPPTPSATPRPAMAPRPATAPSPRAMPAPSAPPASPAPAPAPASAPTPEAPPAETPAPPPAPEPPAEFV